jgi:hypothetical protein
MVDMISASARLLRYDGRLFPTKRVVAPDSNLFVPVLTLSVSMLLPPLQGTSTGAARSMPGLRAAERRVLFAPGAPAEFLLLAGFTPTVGSQDHTSRSDPEVKTWAPLDVENKMHRSAMMVDHNCGERFVQEWRVIACTIIGYILFFSTLRQ